MLTILIPMSGDNNFVGDEYDFPKPLIDIQGYPMIEWVIKNFESIVDKKFIFIVIKQFPTIRIMSIKRL